jgi:hypothetical protein
MAPTMKRVERMFADCGFVGFVKRGIRLSKELSNEWIRHNTQVNIGDRGVLVREEESLLCEKVLLTNEATRSRDQILRPPNRFRLF